MLYGLHFRIMLFQRKTTTGKPNKPYKAAKLNIPLKYKGLKPEDRNINEYVDYFKGARK